MEIAKMDNHVNGRGPAVKEMTGQEWAAIVRRYGPAWQALFAADLVAGRVQLINPTTTQARALTRVSATYVYTAINLTPDERRRIEFGALTLSDIRNKHRSASSSVLSRAFKEINAELSDADIEVGALIDLESAKIASINAIDRWAQATPSRGMNTEGAAARAVALFPFSEGEV
jgi:hypothetical protein